MNGRVVNNIAWYTKIGSAMDYWFNRIVFVCGFADVPATQHAAAFIAEIHFFGIVLLMVGMYLSQNEYLSQNVSKLISLIDETLVKH